ncbi:MAG: hypothetical protein DI536_30420 [Archangium gephyra]|uniref:Lipoprotein n=1 Tax=Archangium gephyra TaxID=48 RepID=A0A2W5SXB0_9BACT|nr:MAG: hypothetical protein DI536_30420 [Archangium gephyra]
MNRLVSAAAVVVIGSLSGCENRCEPGELTVIAGVAQNVAAGSVFDAIEVAVGLGECHSDAFPTPVVTARGPTGEAVARKPRATRLVGRVEFIIGFDDDVPRGWSDIALEFPAATRSFRAYHANPLRSLETIGEPHFACVPPFVVQSNGIVCNDVAADGTNDITESTDPFRTVSLPGRLWSTPLGTLLTTENGIGWFPDIPLTGWVPTRALPGEVLHVTADADRVYVLQPGMLTVLSRDLTNEIANQPTVESSGPAYLLVDGADVVVAGERSQRFTWSGGALMPVGDGVISGVIHGATGTEAWTCDASLIRRYTLRDGELELTGSFPQFGRCHSARGYERPAILAARNTFLACPYSDGDAIKMVELSVGAGGEGACFDGLMVVRRSADSSTLLRAR